MFPKSRGLAQGVASIFNGVRSHIYIHLTSYMLTLQCLPQLGLGLGGPIGGLVTDWFVH